MSYVMLPDYEVKHKLEIDMNRQIHPRVYCYPILWQRLYLVPIKFLGFIG